MAVIIVEGPDGSGKTTLVEKLRATLGARVIHHGPYSRECVIAWHYRRSVYRALLDEQPVILDRSWISEPIYGAAARDGATRVSVHERRGLERLAHRAGAVVVLCLPSIERCESAWQKRRGTEYLERSEQLHQVYEGYAELLAAHPADQSLPVVRYDYATDSTKDLLFAINKASGSPPSVRRAPGLGRFASGVTLLVGEEVGGGTTRTLDLPFLDPTRRGCSAWLSDRLHEWRVPESSLYWVNAYHDGAATSLAFVAALEPRRIVALGHVARTRLTEAGLRFSTVTHPQFWKRFKHHEEYPLRRLL